MAKNKTMYFIYYKNGNLFKGKRLVKQMCMNSGFTANVYKQSTAVMSTGIPGHTVKNLTQKVIIKFHVADPKVRFSFNSISTAEIHWHGNCRLYLGCIVRNYVNQCQFRTTSVIQ